MWSRGSRDAASIAVVTGVHDADDAVTRFEDILTTAQLHDLAEVLIDYRGLDGQGSAVQEILYALRIAELYHAHLAAGGGLLRLAYVGNEKFIGGWGTRAGIRS